MAKIHINNPKQVINGGAKKYYFKVKGLGGPKGDKGDKGDTGATGPEGPQGNAATVSIGSTTTLPVGYDATVTNSGSIYNAVLNFGIPQGPRGPQGATGAKGDKGDKGDQGNPGPQGERGTNATVYIGTTSTLNPGSQATVYNSGTDSNAVLNFGIPKGEKGDTGPMPTIAQTTGQAADQVMSQKATTDALNTKQATITSSNKLSADLVDDTSTTNKFVKASDITNWNGKQDALTAGNNIDIEDGVISTPAIAPEVVEELPATGDEGKLYLTPKAHTTQTATGNPIEATVTAQAGQLESFQLYGDTFQQTYTGKNLFNKNDTGILDDVRVSTSDGKTYGSVGSHVSYFIKVEPSTTYALTTGRTSYYAWYSAPSEDSYISGSGWNDNYYFTSPANAQYIRFDFTDGNIVQFVKGTSVGDYEPYVGGQPSPNPDYPQQIQTVTGEQTVEIVGKNLFDKSTDTIGYYLNASGNIVSNGTWSISGYIAVKPGENYTISGVGTPGILPRYCFYNSSKQFVNAVITGNQTVTVPSGANYIRLSIYNGTNGLYPNDENTLQLELGSTASSYTPYSKQTYPISLGSIELCKLGTYQDYIYKDGSDWKVHKAVAKHALTPNEGWLIPNPASYPNLFQTNAIGDLGNLSDAYTTASTSPQAYCEALVYLPGSGDVRTTQGFSLYHTVEGGVEYNIARINIAGFTTTTQLNNWLSTCNASFWYGVKKPTDTTITDTNLIAQLEAVRTASLENGTNTITNTATGTNLAGDMEIGYFGFKPTNRYDKFIWLDLNNNYEQIGGE